MILNAALPGTGIVVGPALTALNLIAQQEKVNSLPQDKEMIRNERNNVNIGNLITIATTITSIAISTLIYPVIKDTIAEEIYRLTNLSDESSKNPG